MAELVDNAGEAAFRGRRGDGGRHVVQEEVGADDGRQLPVPVNRHAAHDADLSREHVGHHVREEQFARLRRAGVPVPLPHGEGDNRAVFVKFGGRMVVRQQHHAVHQGDVAGIDPRGVVQRGHQLRHVRGQPQLFGDGRISDVDPVLGQQLDGDLPVLRGVGRRVGVGRICRRIGEEPFRVVGQHGDGGAQVLEHVVRQHGFHLRALGLGLGDHGFHGLLRNRNDRLLLLVVRLRDERIQRIGLVHDDDRISRHGHQHGNEHQVENLMFDAAEYEITEFFHRTKPPRSISSIYIIPNERLRGQWKRGICPTPRPVRPPQQPRARRKTEPTGKGSAESSASFS